VHSLEESLHETIIWANYADLKSHCCPQRTNIRVTQGVTTLENPYARAGCPPRTKSCDALIRQLDYDQGKENNAMLNEQNYGGRKYSEGEKDQHNPHMENIETPHTQSQQCLHNSTATLAADLLCKTGSFKESEQPCGNTQGGKTGTVKTWFTLEETNQHQPMAYDGCDKNITGNKGAPLIVYLLLHLFTLYECMTAHHPSNTFIPQPDYWQCKSNSGKDPTALPHTCTTADSEVFWQLRRQALDGKVHGEKAYYSLISTPTGPIPPTYTPCTLTTTISPITTMMHSYTYKEQALKILWSHDQWNTCIMQQINVICNTFLEDLSELYELYGLLIWPYTIEEIVHHL
jgi:hypothetical protein